MRTLFWLLILFLPNLSFSQNIGKGNLEYQLSTNSLHASLEMNLMKETFKEDTIIFSLHAKAEIIELSGLGVKGFEFSELDRIGNMRAHQLKIIVDHNKIGPSIKFNLKYKIDNYSMYFHKEHWLEIHSEFASLPRMRNIEFDWSLDLTMPSAFNIVSDGNLKQLNKSNYRYTLKNSTTTPTILGGDQLILKQYKNSKYPNLIIGSYFDEYNMMDTISASLEKALDFYHATFALNDHQSDFKFVIIPFTTNVSFKRNNLTASRYFQQGDRFIARMPSSLGTPLHEICHLWWTHAPSDTYDNWINESFAEYWSMLAIKEIYGEEYFKKDIAYLKNKKDNYGPIINFETGSTMILYIKGAYILHELHQRMGNNQFVEFSRKLIDQRIDTVDKCIALLKRDYGAESANWLYQKLRE